MAGWVQNDTHTHTWEGGNKSSEVLFMNTLIQCVCVFNISPLCCTSCFDALWAKKHTCNIFLPHFSLPLVQTHVHQHTRVGKVWDRSPVSTFHRGRHPVWLTRAARYQSGCHGADTSSRLAWEGICFIDVEVKPVGYCSRSKVRDEEQPRWPEFTALGIFATACH